MGQRLRINSSKTEYFLDSVEDTAKSFKICGYNYQKTKKELLKFKDEDPVSLVRKEKVHRGKPDKGLKAFYISKYDPRLPHPRQLISRNYHHMMGHPILSNLFPRENLVGGTIGVYPICQKYCLLLSSLVGAMEVTTLVVEMMMMGVVKEDGMDHTTASSTRIRGGVTCAAIWWRPPPSPPPSSGRDSPYMAGTFTCRPHRRKSSGGLSMSVKTQLVASFMWEAQ